jgi:hypothetical protein
MHKWDADSRNKHNDLGKYFQSLTQMQKELIKRIAKKPIHELLTLDEEGFLKQLRDSLTLKEIGKLSNKKLEHRHRYEDQGLMLDTMQEQEFTTNKFGQNFHVDAPTAIIASANPVGGSWKSYDRDGGDKIDLDKIPMIKPLIDRFDLIFTPKENTSEEQLAEYADRKSEMEDKATPDYMVYIAKHIMYAKQRCPKPKFSEEANAMLNQCYVNVRSSYGSMQ